MLGVGLPQPVGCGIGEVAKARLALAQGLGARHELDIGALQRRRILDALQLLAHELAERQDAERIDDKHDGQDEQCEVDGSGEAYRDR